MGTNIARSAEAWNPFPNGYPAGWHKKFLACLNEDPKAERLRKFFIPRCDFVKVGVFALAFVTNPQTFFRERQQRYEKHEADLLAEERRLESELSGMSHGFTGGPITADMWQRSYMNAQKIQQLATVKENKLKVRRLMNERSGGTRDLRWLVIIKEYLEAASGGASLQAPDLGAILDAACSAANLNENESVDGPQLFQDLSRFAKRNPEIVQLAHNEAIRLKKSVPPFRS